MSVSFSYAEARQSPSQAEIGSELSDVAQQRVHMQVRGVRKQIGLELSVLATLPDLPRRPTDETRNAHDEPRSDND